MNKGVIKEANHLNDLWVEGPDDVQLMTHLLRHYNLADEIHVESKEGINNMLKILKIALKGSELRRLGIIVDADEDVHQRWRSFYFALGNAGYINIPQQPVASGTIITQDGLPDIGIWLMPDNRLTGMVEHFASALIPPEDVLWPLVDDIIQKVIDTQCHFVPAHQIKAKIHTWLAWQKEPGKPMGLAITKKYLDANAPHAQQLLGWVRHLFDLL